MWKQAEGLLELPSKYIRCLDRVCWKMFMRNALHVNFKPLAYIMRDNWNYPPNTKVLCWIAGTVWIF